jgi:hypothetical protein
MSFDPQKVLREQEEARRTQSWFLSKIHEFNAAHNRLKHHVHTAYRYPLPPWGRAVMGLVYFSMPVVVGYAITSWVVSRAESTVDGRLGQHGMSDEYNRMFGVNDLFFLPKSLTKIVSSTVKFDLSDKTHIQGLGDKKIVKDESGEHTEVVGAGGWGGGVRLAKSDPETHDINRVNLERFLRKQRRLKEKREREALQKTEPNE